MQRLSVLFVLICFKAFSNSSVAQQNDAPIEVDVIYPNQITQNISLTLSGTIEAKQDANLASLESGRVDELFVEIGDEVEKGQALLRLNDDLGKLQVASAKASLQAAKVNLKEAQRLYSEVLALSEQQVVAQTLIGERAAFLANAEAELARAQANLALQQEILKRHTLEAPFTGIIASRDVDAGEWVSQQDTVLSLVDVNHLRLNVFVPQQYYHLLANARDVPVTVIPDVQSLGNIQATLSRFVPVSNSSSRAFQAQIDLPLSSSANAALATGMSARAKIDIPSQAGAEGLGNSEERLLILPLSAVKQHPDGGSSVFVVENGKAKRIITPFVNLLNGEVSVSGLPANKPYIITGVEILRDGSAVIANDVSERTL
ncbi:efflux RND transporter periplasmic adaptor subunit [Glaciecola siphonariae]|uniref:Efflux RND transporter periplasmic adaptor subunit n=1 Tax=Glaciecola siphonariae TaxID=521012 RepID=A0ABV9LXP0_9ALTE